MFRRKKRDEKVKEKPKSELMENPTEEETTEYLTTPTAVESASEDALLIKVEELYAGDLEQTGDVIDLEKHGKLTVKNLGETDRIFDVDLKLENVDHIQELTPEMEIPELGPQEAWEKEYTVEEADASELPFKFQEIINTNPDGSEPSTVLTYGHEMNIQIKLQFDFTNPLDTLTLEKELPYEMKNVSIVECTFGTPHLESNKLTWELSDISEDTTAVCVIGGKVEVNSIDPRTTGQSKISFSGKGERVTKLKVLGADGYVRCRIYVESDERDEEPDMWDNKLIIENRSEFPIELRKINVSDADNVYLDITFSENEVIIPANGKWESEPWSKQSEDIPMFKKSVNYTIKPEIISESLGKLNVKEKLLPVAYGTGEKSYSQTVFPSFRETPLSVVTSVCNSGSVTFSFLVIEDELPAYMTHKDLDSITVLIKKHKDSLEEDTETVLSKDMYQLSLEPEDFDVTSTKKLICKINTPIEPQSCVVLQYDALMVKPPAGLELSGQPLAHATLTEPAPQLDIPIDAKLETIQVVHLRRRLTWFKDIIPKAAPGTYEIILYLKNRSNMEIQNISLRDIIPTNFTLAEDDYTYPSRLIETTDEGEVREWTINGIEPDKEIEIRYVVEGKGQYHGKDLLVSY